MNKINRALSFALLSAAISLSASAKTSSSQKVSTDYKISSMSEKEVEREKERLVFANQDYLRKRASLILERKEVARKLSDLEKNLERVSTSNSAKLKRTITNKLVKEEVKLKMELVELDSIVAELDRKRLDVDEALFELESNQFDTKYMNVKTILDSDFEKLPKLKADGKSSVSLEKAVIEDIEPGVLKYWGLRKQKLNGQILKARKNRLALWEKELEAHRKFLKLKNEDFGSKTKRLNERKVNLKNYFSLKNSRRQLNYDLIRVESESWQASRRMRYELSSLYRRLAYLERVRSSKNRKQEQFSLLEPAPREWSDSVTTLKVAEYALGVKYDDLYNWSSRIVEVIKGSSAGEANLMAGDEIVYVNEIPVIGSERSFKSLLRGKKDKEVKLVVLRDGALYRTSAKFDYRPEEVSHPAIIKQLQEAEKSNDKKLLAKALLKEVDYVNNYSRDKKVADSTTDELVELLNSNPGLDSSLRLKAYVASSSHYLTRMGDTLNQAKRKQSNDADDIASSAGFLNSADLSAKKVLKLSSDPKSFSIEDCWTAMELVKKYRKYFDFKQIGTPDILKELCDNLVNVAKEESKSHRYQSASLLNRLSKVYELSLKDNKKAAQILKLAFEQYLFVVPEEAKELTELRLVLARNQIKSGDLDGARSTLESRLSTLTSIAAYSSKAKETGMYGYVLTLKELGKIYQSQADYQNAYNSAKSIIDVYEELDANKDETYNQSLYLAGRSLMELNKPKKAIPLLTEAYDLLGKEKKFDCLADLANCYNRVGKSKEGRVLSLVVKDKLSSAISSTSSAKDLKKLGDRAVTTAMIFDSTGDQNNAVALFDTAISAYTASLERMNAENEDGKLDQNIMDTVTLLSKQMEKFSDVLTEAGRFARAKNVVDFRGELDSKIASKSKFEADWLVRMP